jgi:hypothetical protein
VIDRRLPNPGECLVYYTGRDLASERGHNTPDGKALNEYANDMWAASERGEVVLYQRKMGGMYQYVAEGVQRLRPLKPGKAHRSLVRGEE